MDQENEINDSFERDELKDNVCDMVTNNSGMKLGGKKSDEYS